MFGYPSHLPPNRPQERPVLSQLHLPKGNKRRPLASGDLRKLLSDEISATKALPDVSQPANRIVSDPLPRRPSTFAKELGAVIGSKRGASLEPKPLVASSSLAFSNLARGRRARATSSSDSPRRASEKKLLIARPRSPLDASDSDREHDTTPQSCIRLPIGTVRPTPLTTSLLNPRSHKTVQGHVTVLPSRSLLVDFREGERRRGNPGDHVFIVSPDGLNIKVYSAPHLNTPCCLVEHVSEYDIASLPTAYWKQYNDAIELIDRIKQRTPKLVLHEDKVKYTLMANEPLADVEILALSTLGSHERDDNSECVRMRVRVSRQRRMIEIAHYKTDTRGREWKKKTIPTSSDFRVPFPDLEELDEDDRAVLNLLPGFFSLCDVYERMSQSQSTLATTRPETCSTTNDTIRPPPVTETSKLNRHSSFVSQINLVSSSVTNRATTPTPEEEVLPPAKLSTTNSSCLSYPLSRIIGKENLQYTPASNSLSTSILTNRATFEATPSWTRNSDSTTIHTANVSTRFIPATGWCIRQCSRVSQGGRYKIMFLDGAALDVDVDEDWVELRDRTGGVTRQVHQVPDLYSVRDKRVEKAIGDRMRAFRQFVSLFEDEE
ncbi:hypothetical protein BDZ89DRAFT_1126603 [Hymenopellis radicata]|nr:hypothetical protein BDZ89DRAFT_1126603 [Hymenopellis radicata]